MRKIAIASLLCIGLQNIFAQENFTKRDSLHGGLRFERTSYDVLHYDLNIKVNPDERFISGYNEIAFKAVEETNKIQVDLFENMKIDSIIFNSKKLPYKREFDAVFISFENPVLKNSQQKIRVYYSGNPIVAKRAPWDGGFVFSKDQNGKPWIGVAVQGTGASLWYPVKDSQSDEPDNGATIKIAVPNGLMDVSNGRFIGSQDLKNGYTRWDWEVKNPINNYDITANIGDYAHIHDHYKGLDLDYYVLSYNEEIAKKHFEEVKPMMDCFQSKFGNYPFPEDGYKLVETPYLGMEHQSAVAYGNNFKQGYKGSDLSGTGNGLLFDFITIHESGHEWFGNSITSKDVADMWIHESFTCYSETVFLECQFGIEKAMAYVNGLKKNVQNDKPVIGKYGVNNEGSGDMYYKGALMLNTIRSIINEDTKFWKVLLDYSNHFRHQIIETKDAVDFFNAETGMYLTPVFNQYLRYKNIPILQLRKNKKAVEYRWVTDEPDFEMPVEITANHKNFRLNASNKWQSTKFTVKNIKDVTVAQNRFYVEVQKL
ncbi:M1 family metallopeptidase [Flavobacterium noncentrifugens]|nr:M1 family metallopeptidase [Flavobacterium noncentrifugens]